MGANYRAAQAAGRVKELEAVIERLQNVLLEALEENFLGYVDSYFRAKYLMPEWETKAWGLLGAASVPRTPKPWPTRWDSMLVHWAEEIAAGVGRPLTRGEYRTLIWMFQVEGGFAAEEWARKLNPDVPDDEPRCGHPEQVPVPVEVEALDV